MRLSDALKDDAYKAKTALFAAGNSAAEIMKTLEMIFGNSTLILNKIITQINDLPIIDTRKTNLIDFASDLKIAVSTIENLDGTSFLGCP